MLKYSFTLQGHQGMAHPQLALITQTVTSSDGSGNATNSNADAGNGSNSLPAGSFTLAGDYQCPSSEAEVYAVATGGNPGLTAGTNNKALALMAALGPCGNLGSSTTVTINELTTISSIASLAGFTKSYSAVGSSTSDSAQLQAAFTLVNEYVNVSAGAVPGPSLPTGDYASSTEIHTLGNAIASCVKLLWWCSRRRQRLRSTVRTCHSAKWHRSNRHRQGRAQHPHEPNRECLLNF